MITFWNQREIYIGNPSLELKSILDTLSARKIKFKCRVFSESSVHFLNSKIDLFDMFNSKNDSSKIYYVYVHKKDHLNALTVLENL